ncbi:MAG TPA: hypothetical protein DDX54_00260 [Rhodospirillaceae bacterium]|nr:hypothetical protein [Rhodospirillaceae bacterium]
MVAAGLAAIAATGPTHPDARRLPLKAPARGVKPAQPPKTLRAIRFMLLTFQRTGEMIGARPDTRPAESQAACSFMRALEEPIIVAS